LLRLLRVRFGEVPAAAVACVELATMADIERWGERLFTAKTSSCRDRGDDSGAKNITLAASAAR
jgi:hypothetical protein